VLPKKVLTKPIVPRHARRVKSKDLTPSVPFLLLAQTCAVMIPASKCGKAKKSINDFGELSDIVAPSEFS
jgi:hypothetical protein